MLYKSLLDKQKGLVAQAKATRTNLLSIAKEVKEWNKRADRAKQAGAAELSNQADQHLNKLMEKGRLLWQKLDLIGKEFLTIEKELLNHSQKSTHNSSAFQDVWTKLETEHELDQLRQKIRFKS